MKKIELLIGDHEYDAIKKIFEKEEDFQPIDENDKIIIKAMQAIISPNNLMENNVGGEETSNFSVKKIVEPESKEITKNTKINF
jgi:hypothetical protein|tara:strand:+ start:929 stop:1180 length:252 start_codon:yes stop_codon:yes gene_type:complete